MIQVSVTPRQLVAGRRSQLEIRFANTGSGVCTDIVFRLELPSGVALVSGKERVEIDRVRPGRTVVHALTVEPTKLGEFTLTSPNFAYRDEDDESVRVPDWREWLSVEAAPHMRPAAPRPAAPRLRVEHDGGTLSYEEWNVLPIVLRNATGIPLSDIFVALSGPIETNNKRVKIPALRGGQTARVEFSIKASDRGVVPVSVRMTYNYPDGLGSLSSSSTEDQINVLVAKREEQATDMTSDTQTILYLTASPRDMTPLRSGEEMRKVKEKLQLGRDRDAFRLEYSLAARLDDIGQALLDYDPQVVHFSGHGDADGGLYVENEMGMSALLNPDGLAKMFGQHRATVRCVIVNACHSARLAEAMARHIDYAVGMRCAIGDGAAIQFSAGFYQAIFKGWSVPDAFTRGCAMVESNSTTEGEYQTPVLFPPGSA
jgi:CHAT domain/Translocon-associated protein beta (TRAPB)